ncbi:major facilitator family transporter [Streptomyces himastatinicus ATCC 53653]|uniref:Major facilitator family transporter n=1 Tax=Streptomyces himastatinicus ATCC 53653 TaxID=457427 RepID=D9WMR7_9ACTN|nr:MFS transporter [Streptomyces himastatinicus]EFL27933.1 major facilitator family transporter [Streptomyces himastatinicus ATCC 53653]
MFAWYRDTDRPQRRAFWAAFGGWTLEAADAQLFGLVLPTLMTAWQLSTGAAGRLASITLICTAIGGWLAGWASDRYGRVRVLQWTVLVYSTATVLIGFTTGYSQLMVLRSVQGFGFGGEWAAGAVLVSEYMGTRHRGRALGAVQSGWAVGWGLALAAYTFLFTALPEQWAWRSMFWLAALPAVLVIVIRRKVTDPPIYQQRVATSGNRVSLLRIFRTDLLRVTLLGGFLGLGSHGGYYALTTFLPTYLRTEHHLSVLKTSSYLAVFIAAAFFGYVVSGFLADRIGRRRNIVFFAAMCLVSVVVYLFVPITETQMFFLGIPLGFFSAGIPAGLGSLFAELYPTAMRGTGQSFCYNFGRIVAAAFPALVGYLSDRIGVGASIGLFAGTAYGIAVVAALLLPETSHRELDRPAALRAHDEQVPQPTGA